LGQVLIAYFSVLVAVYISVNENIEQKLSKFRYKRLSWVGPSADAVLSSLDSSLTALKRDFASFDSEGMLAMLRGQRLGSDSNDHLPDDKLSAVSESIRKLGRYGLAGPAKERQEECLGLLNQLREIRLRECYAGDEGVLQRERDKIKGIYGASLAITFVHCVVCFWPDPLMSDTMHFIAPSIALKREGIPSGVVVLSVLLVLGPMFLAAYAFVRRVTRVYAIGQGREDGA
jgi:hypothetical protein